METIATQAIRVLAKQEPYWMEDGLWSVWEYPQYPGGVTVSACVAFDADTAWRKAEYAGQTLRAAGWRTELVTPSHEGKMPFLVAYPPGLHNYCPHSLTIRGLDPTASYPDNEVYRDAVLPSEGNARVSQQAGDLQQTIPVDGVACPIYGPSRYGAVTGLPDPCPGHWYIVSMMVAQALPDRLDLLVPGTGPADGAIRENGNIVAVTRLVALNAP